MGKKTVGKKVTKSKSKSGAKSGTLVPQPHGGAIRRGSLPGNTPGTGRPPEAIRAAMRELGAEKGVPFLSDVLDGKINVRFVGKCPKCGEVSTPSATELQGIADAIGASVDQRLKANEQALKYGLGTKDEVTVTDHPKFIEAVRAVRDELTAKFGADEVDAAILRAQAKLNG